MLTNNRKGIIGALLSEYDNVLTDLKKNISDVNDSELKLIVDKETSNKDCASIQSILTHIVLCGYNYVTMIDIHKGNKNSVWPKRIMYNSVSEYNNALDEMFAHTTMYFDKISEQEMAEYNPDKKILTGWGQLYDYEQLMEHAIVHVSRHRLQIQKFKLKLKKSF